MSTFILMLLRNCQSGITRFFGKKCGDQWNSDLIKSVPMLSLTSTELEFHPWHFSHFQCSSPCFYHYSLLMSLTALFFCFLPRDGLCASDVFRVLLEYWRHQDRCTYRMSLGLKAVQNRKLFFVPEQHSALRLSDLIKAWLPHKKSFRKASLNRWAV